LDQTLPSERSAWLAGLPVIATALFHALPSDWQSIRTLQFLPQAIAYVALAAWAARNTDIPRRLGLRHGQFNKGLRWGTVTGLALGAANTGIILWLVPRFGYDITFLRETPHAHLPPPLMLPWFILLIAAFVEINFRGFLLGRLLVLAGRTVHALPPPLASGLAVAATALTFSFDPFMVVTFQHLHWIAVWDGLVWGLLWVRLRNLYVPIVAHAVEVMVMYSVIRAVLA
jgi:membrane protease YdiL (CAAX protease family)